MKKAEIIITLEHGAGGEASQEFFDKILRPTLGESLRFDGNDAARISMSPREADHHNYFFTTDSFTVDPLFFPGGNIGRLAVTGVCNDLAVMGARPRWLSLGLIIGAGFPVEDLREILKSMGEECEINQAKITTGDTKILPGEQFQGLLVNMSGVGEHMTGLENGWSPDRIKPGDELLLSGPPGIHEAVIFSQHSPEIFQSELETDCRSLSPVLEKLAGQNLARAIRDLTRGGLAAVSNEWAQATGLTLEIDESTVPLNPAVAGLCELTGMDMWSMAGEGVFLAALPPEQTETSANLLRENGYSQATRVGRVRATTPGESPRVELLLAGGARRALRMPRGVQLPRIC